MILVLSEKQDLSTTQVIEWLDFFEKKWIRLNNDDKIDITYLGTDILFKLDDFSFYFSELKSVWYRRGFLHFNKEVTNIKEFDNYLNKETSTLTEYLYYQFSRIHHLDTIKNSYVNKLVVNDIANDLGLLTPTSYVFSEKKHLENLLETKKIFVTKSIYGDPLIDFGNVSIKNFTSKVNFNKISTETFAPSLVQDYVEKKYELRIYYFKGDFFSMAIFSQNDNQTKIDFRVYNNTKPNRRVPYNLPNNISKKINKLMIRLGYETGSIDMIVTPENKYIFLEVNPVGQFSMTSFPCNFNVEKKIAEYL